MNEKVNQTGKWERFSRSVYQKVDLTLEARSARRSARSQLIGLNGGLKGNNDDFESDVLAYWERYGIKPSKIWYDLYCNKDGKYDPRYIPEDLYWKVFYPTMNRPSFRHAYTDKCSYEQMFPYLKQPRTIIKNSNGCFFNGSGEIIRFSQAIKILKSEKRFVLKPSINSGEGVDIFFYDEEQKENIDFEELLRLYNSDYIVQEVATQHEVLEEIHPSSLNTIRVISFLFRGEVHISSAILRMGAGGARLDNVSTGGLACPVRPDGTLEEKAFYKESGWITSHPGGSLFSEIKIPSYDRVLDSIRKAHHNIPHFRIIGWDFAIDDEGDPLFIEYNGAPGMNQVSCGPLFGDLTEAVLDTVILNKPEFAN